MGGGSIDIQNLSVTGYDKDEGYFDGEVYIQTLTPGGATEKSFTWIDMPADPDEGIEAFCGWFDDEAGEAASLTVSAGDGLYMFGPNTSFGLRSQGEVPTQDIAVTLRGGAKCVVNPTPVTLDIQDIWVNGYNKEEGYVDGEVVLQTLTPGGATEKSFTWIDMLADPDEGIDAFCGWFDDDAGEAASLTVAPGDGLYAFGPNTSFSVVFPGVEL